MADPKPALEAPVSLQLNLMQKISLIQEQVGIVKKGGYNSEHKYKFLQIEDAVLAVGKLLSKYDLVMTGTLAKKPDGHFYCERTPHSTRGYMVGVVYTWSIEDIITGETRVWDIPGDGYDTTDKGVYKAQTGSRKSAIILIFNLAVGDEVDAKTNADREAKTPKSVAANKIAEAASRGVPSAIDAMSQVEPEKKLVIARPEEYNGHYIIASGFIAAPALDTFFSDTGCKRIDSRKTGKTGWKVPAEYEKGLLALCEKLGIEIEG